MKDEDPTSMQIFIGACVGIVITLIVALIWNKIQNKPKKDEIKPKTEIVRQSNKILTYNGKIIVFSRKTNEEYWLYPAN